MLASSRVASRLLRPQARAFQLNARLQDTDPEVHSIIEQGKYIVVFYSPENATERLRRHIAFVCDVR